MANGNVGMHVLDNADSGHLRLYTAKRHADLRNRGIFERDSEDSRNSRQKEKFAKLAFILSVLLFSVSHRLCSPEVPKGTHASIKCYKQSMMIILCSKADPVLARITWSQTFSRNVAKRPHTSTRVSWRTVPISFMVRFM